MRYIVDVMPRAKRQAAAIVAWWRDHRREAIFQFEEDLERLLLSLESFPDRGVRSGGSRERVLYTARTRHAVIYRVQPRARRIEVIAIGR